MEDPRPQLQDALKTAMKNKDNQRRDVIRLAQSAIKQVEIDARKDGAAKELSAEDVVTILQKEARMRRESIDEMRNAGRADDAATGEAELSILEEFLPQQLSREEIITIVQQVIAEVGAQSPQDMGKVMGKVMAQVKGRADGGLVSQVVRESLNK